MSEQKNELMEKIVSLCKRRGFVFPGSEIYGGFANSYTYGPYGVTLKNNIKALWWKMFVTDREDVVGIDGPIVLHPKLWEASGHASGFNDAMVDCKECQNRFRADFPQNRGAATRQQAPQPVHLGAGMIKRR